MKRLLVLSGIGILGGVLVAVIYHAQALTSYSMYPGESIAIAIPSGTTPVLTINFGELNAISKANNALRVVVFGVPYTIDISHSQILDKNRANSSLNNLVIGDHLNVYATLSATDKSIAYAQVVRTPLKAVPTRGGGGSGGGSGSGSGTGTSSTGTGASTGTGTGATTGTGGAGGGGATQQGNGAGNSTFGDTTLGGSAGNSSTGNTATGNNGGNNGGQYENEGTSLGGNGNGDNSVGNDMGQYESEGATLGGNGGFADGGNDGGQYESEGTSLGGTGDGSGDENGGNDTLYEF